MPRTPAASRFSLLLALIASLTAISLATPAFAVETAWVIHGNDRSLAKVVTPAGPTTLNLATVGSFPSEMVRRGTHAWVPCGGSGRVDVVDLAGDPNPDPPTIVTGGGSNPYGMAFVADDRAYVSLLSLNSVAAVDPTSGAVGPIIPVGRSPEGVAVAAGKVFVANSGFDFSTFGYDPGSVSVIDPATNGVVAVIPVGLNPQALTVAPDGSVQVVCTGNYFSLFGRVFVIDPVAVAVTDSVDVGGSPGFIAISPAGIGYLSDYYLGVLTYDAASLAVIHGPGDPIVVGTGAAGIAFDEKGRVYVSVYEDDLLAVVDADGAPLDTHPVGDGPQDVVIADLDTPIAVKLLAFTGEVTGADVVLDWHTADEFDHAGFILERAATESGPWLRLNDALVTAESAGRYRWVDRGIVGGEPGAEISDRIVYRLTAVDRTGTSETFAPITIDRPVDAKATVRLMAPSPNPLRQGSAALRFTLPVDGAVKLSIFDAAGREVARPVDAQLSAGDHLATWDGRSATGVPLAQGVYYLRLTTGEATRTGRIALGR